MTQPTFWDQAGEIVDTRNAAAASVAPFVGGMLRRVLDYIVECGECGATDEQVAIALGMKDNTARARRVELRDGGQVRDSTRRRKSRSGRLSIVWEATGRTLEQSPQPLPRQPSSPDPPRGDRVR